MAHRNARLTPFGRMVLVQRVIEFGWSPAKAAEACQVSRATAYKWLRGYRDEGEAGLMDRTSAPRSCPHRLGQHQIERILKARRREKVGPRTLAPKLRMPRSTIYGVLRRHGLARLDHVDRPTGVPIRRYQKDRAGELVHIDVKKLGKIPAGGGHRMLGRSTTTPRRRGDRRTGYDFIHSAVDDCTRIAFSQILPDEKGETCARFLLDVGAFFADLGITIEAVMTDEAKNYTRARVFKDACAAIGCRHVTTGPYRPRINGKVERFNRTLIWEWAYKRFYATNSARRRAFPRWLDTYNRRRPHTALGGQAPMSLLVNNVRGNHT